MISKTLLLAASAACAAMLLPLGLAEAPATQASAWERPIEFTLSPSGESGEVELSLRHRSGRSESHHSRSIPLAELQGLDAAALAGDGGPLRFRLAREAGALDCEGDLRSGRGSGRCRFTPDASFAAGLEQRGIGRPRAEDQFHLMMSDVRMELVDELARQDYPRPRVSDLVALGIHGGDLAFLRGLDAAGYRTGSHEQLVAFLIHGVTPDYVRELTGLGGQFSQIAADQFVAMRIHGVTPAFARAMTGLGDRDLGPQDLVNLRIHGVDEARVRELVGLGDRELDAGSLVQMAIHDVTPAFIREMAEAGYPDLTTEQLVNLRIHGVRPSDAREINQAVGGPDAE